MKKNLMFVALALVMVLVMTGMTSAETKQLTAKGKSEVRLKLVLGSCVLRPSLDGALHATVEYNYEPEGGFEAKLEERGSVVYLEEKFRGRNPEGSSSWTLLVPEGMEVDFNTATGSLTIEGVNIEIKANSGTGSLELTKVTGGRYKMNTGTGNITVTGSQGEFDLNSGTGNVNVEDSEGNFEANSGTGDVDASAITIEGNGKFNSGTGDVMVSAPRGHGFTLSVSSGTGDATLRMSGQPVEGLFEFTANSRRGRIVSPVRFDKEEELPNGDGTYWRKSFTKGNGTTKYYIETGTGTAKLIQ